MNDIRNQILTNLQTVLNTNTYDVDFVLGKTIMTKDSSLEVETFNGQTIVVKDFIPGMPFVFDGTLIPVDNAFIVNYGIVLEFFVMEALADDVIAALTEIVHNSLQRNDYILDEQTDLNINYLASEPSVISHEIFNYRKAMVIRLPVAGMLSRGVQKGSDIKLSIHTKGSVEDPELIPFLTAAVSLNGEVYSAQVWGSQQTTSIITDKSWAASVVLYAISGTQNRALYDMVKNGSAMNTVFELTIERSDTNSETIEVLVANITETLDTTALQTYTVGFVLADAIVGGV